MKLCTGCQTKKPLTQFWKNKRTKDGYQDWCKPCSYAIKIKRLNGPNREIELRQRQNGHLLRKYGITIEQYEEMWQAQKGLCAICKRSITGKKKLAVDHCHDTLKIRGLLCENCNKGIGMFKHNPQFLKQAVIYLENSLVIG